MSTKLFFNSALIFNQCTPVSATVTVESRKPCMTQWNVIIRGTWLETHLNESIKCGGVDSERILRQTVRVVVFKIHPNPHLAHTEIHHHHHVCIYIYIYLHI